MSGRPVHLCPFCIELTTRGVFSVGVVRFILPMTKTLYYQVC